MKIKLSLLILIFLSINLFSQNSVRLVVFPSLTTMDFSTFTTLNDLVGAPRVFCVEMDVRDQYVVMSGTVLWQKKPGTDFIELGWFVTRPFLPRTLCNDDIGKEDIRLHDYRTNPNLIDENLKLGKPTGTYRLIVELFDSTSQNKLGEDVQELVFLNPSQTISIINPRPGGNYDAGNVLIEWTPVSGVSHYIIKASQRTDQNQSLEEALNRGIPLVNNKNVGVTTSVNLREVLDRELPSSGEIVLQVIGNVEGPSGGIKLYSDIVNFYILSPESQAYQQLANRLNNALSRLGDNELLELLKNNQIDLSKIQIRKEDGTLMTLDELIIFLETNPNLILRIVRE